MEDSKSQPLPTAPASKFGAFVKLLKDSALAWSEDGASSMGAAIAYYTVFSIAPLLVITMAIAGFFFGAEAAQGQIYSQAQSLLGAEGATALQGLVQSASKPAEGILATLVSLIFMILGASGVFAELQGAMDRIWQAPVSEKQSGIWYLLRRRILTFGMLLAIAFLLLVSLAVSAFISTLQSIWSPENATLEVIWQAVNFVVSLVIVSGLFALIFKLLPRVSVAWRDVVVGAVMTAVLFNLGKFLIGLYIGKSGVTSGFGAAGTVIAMVLWIYYSAQIFLFGAEFTWLFAKRFGSLRKSGEGKLKNAEGIVQIKNDHTSPPGDSTKTTLNELFKKLLQDGKNWFEAELTLAKAEANRHVRNYAVALGLGCIGFLIVIATILVFAQALVLAITPYVGGSGIAGLIVGIGFLVVSIALTLIAKHLLTRKMSPIGSVIRQLSGAQPRSSHRSAKS